MMDEDLTVHVKIENETIFHTFPIKACLPRLSLTHAINKYAVTHVPFQLNIIS